MSEVGLVVELVLRLLSILKPSELEAVMKRLRELEEKRVKDRQDALAALGGNTAALNRIISQLLSDLGV